MGKPLGCWRGCAGGSAPALGPGRGSRERRPQLSIPACLCREPLLASSRKAWQVLSVKAVLVLCPRVKVCLMAGQYAALQKTLPGAQQVGGGCRTSSSIGALSGQRHPRGPMPGAVIQKASGT